MLNLINPSVYEHKGDIISNKVLALDLDNTLVRTRKGKFFKDANDYAFLPNRIFVLKKYIQHGYTIAIFTNQKYTKDKLKMAIERKNNILVDLLNEGINPWMYISTLDDNYRKPNIGMWDLFTQNIDVDTENSIFVGDAAGRPQDFSDSDIMFAKNIGLRFFTPEQIFPNGKIVIPDTQTMFIFVGKSGSGKTTFYEDNLEDRGWIHANQDKLGTAAKVLNTVKKALAEGKSVAIDNTNPTYEKRQEYIKLAAQYGVPVLIIYFVGEGHGFNKLREKSVPDIAYNVYYKNLEEPTEELDGVPVVERY